MEFTIEMKTDIHRLRTLNVLTEKTFRRRQMILYRIIVVLLACLAGWSAWNALVAEKTFTGMTRLILTAFLLAAGCFPNALSAWFSVATVVPEGTLTFDQGGFTEVMGGRRVRHRYRDVYELMHFRGYDFLFLDRQRSLIVAPDSFISGDPAAFRPFLEERCGKTFRDVR